MRYEGRRVGGTVVVHFIKKNMWFLETATAFLHGDDATPAESAPYPEESSEPPAQDLDDPARLERRTRFVRIPREQ